jgi:prepilin signal peptidase PulO-like enzyme (type II secretory pathway)
MLIATFIDFDEQTIPDSITVPGTLAGLWFAALLPSSRPLTLALPIPNVEFLHVGSPEAWPAWLDHWPGLMMGLGCFLAWWLAIVPATWTTRRGLSKAWLYFWVSFWRRLSALLLAIVFLGTVAVLGAWLAGRDSWQSLFSALVGVAFGGGLIWAVRIIGSRALGQEAMGFGDVTLMAMIGAFAGWQATLIVFFLAPFAAVLISVTQWLLTRRKDIAFGPYLCLAEVYLIVRWKPIWNESARQIFSLGWIIPLLVAVCLVLMGGMLWGMRLVRHRAAAAQLPETDTLAADSAAAVDLPIRGPSAPAGRTVGSDRRHKT